MTIEPAKLKEWARLAKAATPLWSKEVGWRGPCLVGRVAGGRPNGEVMAAFGVNQLLCYDDKQQHSDIDFAIAAREAVPALIEALVGEKATAKMNLDMFFQERDLHLGRPQVIVVKPFDYYKTEARRELGLEDG